LKRSGLIVAHTTINPAESDIARPALVLGTTEYTKTCNHDKVETGTLGLGFSWVTDAMETTNLPSQPAHTLQPLTLLAVNHLT
jgi:hypothetical protein